MGPSVYLSDLVIMLQLILNVNDMFAMLMDGVWHVVLNSVNTDILYDSHHETHLVYGVPIY